MKNDLFNWLKENHCNLDKVAQKWDLDREIVQQAAKSIFEEVQNGEKVKPILVAWKIRGRAMFITNQPKPARKKAPLWLRIITLGVKK